MKRTLVAAIVVVTACGANSVLRRNPSLAEPPQVTNSTIE